MPKHDLEKEMSNSSNKKPLLLNNQSNELFDDDDYVVHKLINVKFIRLPNSGEDWEILEDSVVVLTLKGTRLTQREKNVLYTPEGLNIVMSEYKSGNKSVAGIKQKLRDHWKAHYDKV